MDIQRFGLILNVENFNECVEFYKNVFNLKVLFSEEGGDFKLTCLELGDAVVGNLKKYGIESNLLVNPWGKL